MTDVLVCGLAVCDIIVRPVTSRCLVSEVSDAEDVEILGGGDAYNVSINLARLGIKSALCARVGCDELGDMIIKRALDAGVDCRYVIREGVTTVSVVLVDESGQRHFVVRRGSCDDFCESDVPDSALDGIKLMSVNSAFALHSLDGDGMHRLFERAKERGITTALDMAGSLEKPAETVLGLLPLVDVFLPSEDEALYLAKTKDAAIAAEFLRSRGAGAVAVKLGEKGSVMADENGLLCGAPIKVGAVDTTGAGDAFFSGFLCALCRSMSHADCLRFANAAGAVAVTGVGATGAIKSYEQVAALAGL